MFLLLFMMWVHHPGETPGAWESLPGATGVSYRWSLPLSDSCRLDFLNNDEQPKDIVIQARVRSQRLKQPLNPADTAVKQPSGAGFTERSVSVHIVRMGQQSAQLSFCYGVAGVKATSSPSDATTSKTQHSAAK